MWNALKNVAAVGLSKMDEITSTANQLLDNLDGEFDEQGGEDEQGVDEQKEQNDIIDEKDSDKKTSQILNKSSKDKDELHTVDFDTVSTIKEQPKISLLSNIIPNTSPDDSAVDSLHTKIQQLESENQKLSKQNETLISDITLNNNSYNKTITDQELLHKEQLLQLTQQQQAYDTTIKELTENNHIQLNEINILKQRLIDQKSTYEKTLEEEKQTWINNNQGDLEKLIHARDALTSHITTIEAQNERYKAEVGKWKATQLALQASYDELKSELSTSLALQNSKIDTLTKLNQDLEDKKTAYEQQLLELQSQLHTQTNEILELKQKGQNYDPMTDIITVDVERDGFEMRILGLTRENEQLRRLQDFRREVAEVRSQQVRYDHIIIAFSIII